MSRGRINAVMRALGGPRVPCPRCNGRGTTNPEALTDACRALGIKRRNIPIPVKDCEVCGGMGMVSMARAEQERAVAPGVIGEKLMTLIRRYAASGEAPAEGASPAEHWAWQRAQRLRGPS